MPKDERLIQWLRDAHAMEMQAHAMLSGMAERIENYPDLKQGVAEHIAETKRHGELLEGCIRRLGGGVSGMKDMAGRATGMVQNLAGLFMADEIVKGAMASYTFEHFEISAYKALCAAAEEVGDTQTRQVCEQILAEEERMAAWMSDMLPDITRRYLMRVEAGMAAKV